MEMNQLSDANKYLEKTLKIEQQLSNDLATDNSVATILHEIGQSFLEMSQLSDAKDHLENALKIEHQTILLLTTMWLLFCMKWGSV